MVKRESHYVWEWQLHSTPEQLWPYVSDTQRFNRVAVGYRVQTTKATDEDVQHIRASYVIPLAWDEYPFEWERPRRAATRSSSVRPPTTWVRTSFKARLTYTG